MLVLVFLTSCKKDKEAPSQTLNETVDSSAMLSHSGNFVSGPFGTTTGMAEVYKQGSTYQLKLANFNVNNGPALHVYLSKEAMPINFIDLGSLKSTMGNQVYPIPSMPNFTDYKYISIHCVDYNHLFGYALLN